jgi:hypothetical protein
VAVKAKIDFENIILVYGDDKNSKEKEQNQIQ